MWVRTMLRVVRGKVQQAFPAVATLQVVGQPGRDSQVARDCRWIPNDATVMKLWGTGTPLREFLWSEEMADASVFVMEHVDFKDTYKQGDKDIRNCHINIGTGKEISIRELAELIVSTVGYQGQLTFDSTKPDGTMRKLTDPSKLHALGWHHKVEIEEGVQRMYNWYLGR